MNSGIEVDDVSHLSRINYCFVDAKIILSNKLPIELLKVNEQTSYIKIIQFQLDPKYKNLGIGTNIMQSIIEDAAAKKIPILLSVLKTNPAKRLYEQFGFVLIEETKDSFEMKSF